MTTEPINSSENISDNQTPSLSEVMNRILASQEWDQAVDYESGKQNTWIDTIVFLCKSESGIYEAYGFISTEYGQKGLLMNNIIDGESNWNYFEESWSHGNIRPTLEEKGTNEVLFTFTAEDNGTNDVRSLYFDTYDTGTMSKRG